MTPPANVSSANTPSTTRARCRGRADKTRLSLDDHNAYIVDGRCEGQEILDDGVVDRSSGLVCRAPDGVLETPGNVGVGAAAVFGESVRKEQQNIPRTHQ